jgi:hypothetical protein
MPDVETAAETARAWVSWGQAAALGKAPCASEAADNAWLLLWQQLPDCLQIFCST